MFLKKLVLKGFKSFAKPTEFLFEKGFTVIIGPNGSGKTNIIDAIRWVFGSHKTSTFRAEDGVDVIYNGSNGNTTNFAEVCVTFSTETNGSNTDITITRRVYRDGLNEYFIDGQPCRYRDLRDFISKNCGMFLDSIFFKQGQIDNLITAPSSERLKFFEDISGISYYNLKRDETIHKLERVENELSRLRTLLRQLKSDRERLEKNAQRAQLFNSLKTQIVDFKKKVYTFEASHLRSELNIIENNRNVLEADLNNLQHLLAETTAKINEINQEILLIDTRSKELEMQWEKSNNRETETRENMHQLQLQINEEKSATSFYNKEIINLESDLKNLTEKSEGLRKEICQINSQIDSYNSEISPLSDKIESIEKEYVEQKQLLDASNKRIFDLTYKITKYENELKIKEQEIEKNRLQIENKNKYINDLRNQIENFSSEIKKIDECLNQCIVESQELKNKINDIEKQKIYTNSNLETLNRKKEEVINKLSQLESKLNYIKAIESNQRRNFIFSDLTQTEKEEYKIVGFVGDFVDTQKIPPNLYKLIERKLDWLIVKDRTGLTKLINKCLGLNTDVTILIQDEITEKLKLEPSKKHLVIEQYSKLNLLSKKDDGSFECGIKLPFEIIYLLLGEFATPGMNSDDSRIICKEPGVIELFAPPSLETDTLYRKTEYEKLLNEYSECSDLLQSIKQELAESEKKVKELNVAEQEIRIKIYEISTNQVENSKKRELLEYRLANLNKELTIINNEISHCEQTIKLLSSDVVEIRSLYNKLTEDLQLEKQVFADKNNEVRQIENLLTTEKNNLTNLRNELAKLEELRRMKNESLEEIEKKIQSEEKAIGELKEKVNYSIQRQQALDKEFNTLSSSLESIVIEKNNLKGKLMEYNNMNADYRKKITELQNYKQEIENNLRDVNSKLQSIMLNKNKLELELKNVAEKMQELNIVTDSFSELVSEEEYQELKRNISKLENELIQLGQVDSSSIREFNDLNARIEQLEKEYREINSARRTLIEFIQQLEQEASQIFTENISKVSESFNAYSRKIFGGGKAIIKLITKEGLKYIDFIVEIPGKNITSIDLLSGGEKSVLSFALLMSFFKLKHNSFYLLDEADSALDEVNSERIANLLKEISLNSQIIAISHNKKTIAYADQIIGISMGKDGLSKKVSVKLN